VSDEFTAQAALIRAYTRWGMVAHVEIARAEFKMAAEKLALAINAHLPEDIRVVSARRCPADFHARFDAAANSTVISCGITRP